MNKVEVHYGEYVAGKLKDPTAVCDFIGEHPAVANAVHLAMGVVGEAIELMISTDRTNTIEELGDIEFYMQGFTNMGFADAWMSQPYSYHFNIVAQSTVIRNIVEDAGALVDAVKKMAIYQKEPNLPEFNAICRRIHLGLEQMYTGLNITREHVLQVNKDKLDKRYASGYSDKAAHERADKSA